MIYINENDPRPIYLQIYDAIKSDILEGKMEKDTPLLPIRVLTSELKISKNTVEHAYQELLSEGLIRAVKGSGYYVEDIDTFYSENYEYQYPENKNKILDTVSSIKYDFRYSIGDSKVFPWSKWKQCVNNSILDEAAVQFSKYESNKGFYPLRVELSKFLQKTRGVNCQPEQIVICAGTMYAVEMILSLIPSYNRIVGFEEPGYIGMRKVFTNNKCAIRYINIQKDGIDLNELDDSMDIVYLTPSHQFPTGATMSLEKRLKLIEWAYKNQSFIIENDYDSEFMYKEHILPSIQSLDTKGNVIYIGTLSKAIMPSIRCAYFVLPKPFLQLYERKYHHCNSLLPTFVQRSIYYFIEGGHLEKHIRKLSMMNENKMTGLVECMKKAIPEGVHISGTPSGTHFLIRIEACSNEKELIEFMKKRSIGIHGTKKYWSGKEAPENIFIIGFSSIPDEKIEKYVSVFSDALKEYIDMKLQ